MWRVLVSTPHFIRVLPDYAPRLQAAGIETVVPPHVAERLEEEDVLRWARDVDGAICGDDRFTARVFAACPRLKVLVKWGTGVDSIDREAARRHGVQVFNTPGGFTEPVADTVFAYLLAFARNIVRLDRDVRTGAWTKPAGVTLRECTLGVLGVGQIGRAVVARAAAFGMTLLGCDPRPVPEPFLASTGLVMVSKEELLRRADFLVLCCDLNPTSHHAISAPELRAMRRTSYLINVSRGPVVDEPSLIEALRARTLAGAALDVFEVEPLPPASPLRQLDNCLLSPHNANSSPAAVRQVHEHTVHQLIQALSALPRDANAIPPDLLHAG